jgi:hypothetical protein
VPYVLVCEDAIGGVDNCPKGKDCTNYHIYVRPETMDIVKKIYPIRRGIKAHYTGSGAKIEGNVFDELFSGYGTMTWPNGNVYVGDWKEGRREG